MASETAQATLPLQVPPLPPKLRRRPQRSSIGEGGEYADDAHAAFDADDAAWLAEWKRGVS